MLLRSGFQGMALLQQARTQLVAASSVVAPLATAAAGVLTAGREAQLDQQQPAEHRRSMDAGAGVVAAAAADQPPVLPRPTCSHLRAQKRGFSSWVERCRLLPPRSTARGVLRGQRVGGLPPGGQRPMGLCGSFSDPRGFSASASAPRPGPGPGPGPGRSARRHSPRPGSRPEYGSLGGGAGPAGLGSRSPSHGPGPGLPLEPTTHGSPLPRPDHLAPGAMPDPVNIAADHQGDPRDVIQRLLQQTAPGLLGPPPWGSDTVDNEELRQHREQTHPLAAVLDASGPPPTEQLRRLSATELSAVAVAVMPSLPPGRVAQLAVALARLGHFDMQYKAALVEHVVGRMYQFTPPQLSDVAWAVAACGYYDLPFLEALAGRLRETASQWDARSLAKVLWAFGRFHYVGREPSVGAEALEAMVEKLQDEMDGSTMAEVVFAAGQLCGSGADDWQFDTLQGLVTDFALFNMEAFGPEALGKLASGLTEISSAGVEQGLCDAVAHRAAQLAHRLEPEDICRVMELLQAHGKVDWDALEALAVRAVELSRPPAERLDVQQAAALVAGFNVLGHVSESVLALAAKTSEVMSTPAGDFAG